MRPLPLACSRRSLFGRAATTLFALALAGGSALATAQSKAETLRIGYQKSASLFVLQKAQGTLEKRLAPLNVDVRWVEFPAGPQLLEGLNVGSVDVGHVGEAPPIFAQAAGANFVYIGNDPAAPEADLKLIPKTIRIADALKPATKVASR
jgi:sulfonate transport system substrate-binding protein